jgi:hypothetical protein
VVVEVKFSVGVIAGEKVKALARVCWGAPQPARQNGKVSPLDCISDKSFYGLILGVSMNLENKITFSFLFMKIDNGILKIERGSEDDLGYKGGRI